jgi:magnesium-transporting ATPase (P-type)
MFDAIRVESPVPAALSNYIQPNLGHGLRIWWAFFWPSTLISIVLTIVVNYWMRYFYENSNVPGSFLGPTFRYDSYFFSYVVAFFVMNYILRKNFRQFRIGLLSNRGGAGSEILRPTFSRTIPVWWTYCWRTFVYALIATFVTAIPRAFLLGPFSRNRVLESLLGSLFGVALGGAIGLFVIYSNILDEDFGDFRVCLLPRRAADGAIVAPASNPVLG